VGIYRINRSQHSVGRLNQRVGAVAVIPWYLSGGIDPANCIAAYQPKGAADLAASYLNLAGSSAYNAAAGNAPDWDATNGWKFNGSNNFLVTGLFPASGNSTIIIRFVDNNPTGDTYFLGAWDNVSGTVNDKFFGIRSTIQRNIFFYSGIGEAGGYINDNSFTVNNGVLAIAGVKGGYNGSFIAMTITTPYSGANNRELVIGARNVNGVAGGFATINVQALAYYDIAIDETGFGLLTTAMNLL
jgi:hypothetical protein